MTAATLRQTAAAAASENNAIHMVATSIRGLVGSKAGDRAKPKVNADGSPVFLAIFVVVFQWFRAWPKSD
jgi:hypothetical protein